MNEIALSGIPLYVVLAFAAFGIVVLAINIASDKRINKCPRCKQWVTRNQSYYVDQSIDGNAVHKKCPND